MKSKFYFQIFVILGLFFYSSCQAKNSNRDQSLNKTTTPPPVITPTDQSLIKTTALTPVITPPDQSLSKTTTLAPIITPTDQFQWTDDFRDGYISKIPIKNLESGSEEEIVNTLLIQWFEHYLNDCEVERFSIRGYKINDIKVINAPWMRNYKIIANVLYTEKPARNEAMKSLSEEQFNSLSFNVFTTFGVLIDGDDYRLRLMQGYGT